MNSTAAILLGQSRSNSSRPWFSVRSGLLVLLGTLAFVLAAIMLMPHLIDHVIIALG